MKPVHLAVEGFTSFRTRQEIAFAGLELFAISGPTGAGKSSLLDAMMYALYGQIPRLGGQGYQEIISHGATRLAVTLDFAVRDRHYRVVRALRRGGQTTAQLVALDPATRQETHALADKVRDVDRQVEAILGLDYRTFAQAVVLPQGDFQRFLKAAPKERRDMLSGLLRLGRYEVMRKAAQKRHDDAAGRIASAERWLADSFHGVDAGAIAAMTADLATRSELVAELHGKAAQAAGALQDTREVAKATEDLATSRKRTQAASEALEVATRQRETAADAFAAARSAAEEVPALTQKISDLDRILGLQSELDASEKALADAEREVVALERGLATTRAALAASTTAADDATKKKHAAAEALARVGYSAERAQRVRELAAAARAVMDRASKRDDARSQLAKAKELRDARAKLLDGRKRDAVTANTALEDAKAQTQAALDALRAEEWRQHAMFLRKGLHPGDDCPVCEQPVPRPPPMPRGVEKALAKADEGAAKARAREAAAQDVANGAREKVTQAATSLQGATARVAELDEQIAAAETTLASLAQKLARDALTVAIAPALPSEAGALLAEDDDLAARQATWQSAQTAHRGAERACDLAAASVRQLSADVANQQTTLDGAKSRRDAARRARDRQRAQVRAVAGDQDPRRLRQQLQARSADLTKRLTESKEAHVEAGTLAQIATAAHATAAGDVAKAAAKLGDRTATMADVRLREQEKIAADAAHTAAVGARAAVASTLARAQADLARADALRQELAAARADADIHGTLARELQSDRFLEWLLGESLRDLVAGASVRLHELSDRYTLAAREGEFFVVDHDNAQEQRSADTLSGGETFLTSLALALELSAQIQATAGAVPLDSIFIDEGFGTLDAETLETVAGAIESLPHGGRMVGIITHVAELTERMPARIVVEKGADSSSARLVGA